MPFTTSHPLAVLPLKQILPRWVSLTGLMAGAMAPDLLYFLILTTEYRGIGHSWFGLFSFCLPAGLVFSFTFHFLFKYHAIIHLPAPFDRWFSGLAESPFTVRSPRGWIILCVSVLIGTLSHFFWDSFTHADGEMVNLLPFLDHRVTLLGITRPYYRILQHVSTLLGAVCLPLYLIKGRLIPPTTRSVPIRTPGEKFRFWLGCGAVSALSTLLAVWYFTSHNGWQGHDLPGYYLPVQTIGLSSWAGMFYAVCGYTVIAIYRKRKAGR